LGREAHLAVAIGLGQPGHLFELRRRHPARGHDQAHVAAAVLLTVDADVVRASLATRILAGGLQGRPERLLDGRTHPRDAPVVDQEGEAAPVAGLARAVVAVHTHDGRGDLGRPRRLDEDVERIGAAVAARAHLPADVHVEAHALALPGGHHGDVLALGADAVLEAT